MQTALEDKLAALAARYEELAQLLGDPEVTSSPERLRDTAREHSQLKELMAVYGRWRQLKAELRGAEELTRGADPELSALAKEEMKSLGAEIEGLEDRLQTLLLPRDPLTDKNAVLEIRAGTGGEEAALFARQLFEMYRRYA